MIYDVEINGVIRRGVTVSVEWCGDLAIVLIMAKGCEPPPPWTPWPGEDVAAIDGRSFHVQRGGQYEAEIDGRPMHYEWSCRCVGSFPFTSDEWDTLTVDRSMQAGMRH